MGFRSVKVRWGVYERLRQLALERGMTIADVIAWLVDESMGNNACNEVLREVKEIKELIRQLCIEKKVEQGNKEASTEQTNEDMAEELMKNPWVEILRARGQ